MTGIVKTDQIQGAGSSTITVPTGNTLNVADNLTVDTNTLHVDASNSKVGIGTTSPEETLEVVHATAPAIQLNRTNDGGFKSILRQQGNDFEIRGSSGSTKIYTGNADGDSSTARLIINASGHTTSPSQPFVTFQGNSNGNTSVGNAERFGATDDGNPAFNTAPQKGGIQGITYNSANGQFTVPTAGRYLIFFQAYYNGGAAQIRIAMYINNIQMALDHNNSMVGTQQLHYLSNASANDYIDFRMISGGTQDWYMGVNHMLGYITLLN